MSKARRAGVPLKPPKKGRTFARTRDAKRAHSHEEASRVS